MHQIGSKKAENLAADQENRKNITNLLPEQQKFDQTINNDLELFNRQVKSGQYFLNARRWFVNKYFTPSTERIYAGILALAIMVTAIMIMHTAKVSSDVTRIPFALYSSPEVEDMYRIIPLDGGKLTVDGEVATYLLEYYVKMRETYLPYYATNQGYREFFDRVKAMSSDQVLDRFSSQMNLNSNPDSPIIRYKFSIERNIRIQEINFLPYEDKPSSAIIKFIAQEIKNGRLVAEYDKKVRVAFSIGSVESGIRYNNGYQFLVYGYEYLID